MNILKKLLTFLTSISLVGCASTREDNGSVLMEDVIVQRTTVRSTTQNPTTDKKNGTVFIQGDNITIGTMIVNSPNARVDNSTNTVQVQQNFPQSNRSEYQSKVYYNSDSGLYSPYEPPKPLNQPGYNSDRDFFKKIKPHIITLIPSIIMMKR